MFEMQFVMKVVFLSSKPMTLQNGTQLHTLSFFEPGDQGTVNVNVMASNDAVCSVLPSLSFGSPCNATFALRDTVDKQSGKQYLKLALVGLSPVKS